MPTYAIPPAALIDTYEIPVTNIASPHEKQIDGGVTAVSTAGQFQVVTQTRPLRAILKTTAEYQVTRDFFKQLKGRPFTFSGANWIVIDKTWTPIGFTIWQLDMTLSQFFG